MPCCAAIFVTIRFHSTLPSHAIRGPNFWMAVSNPKRTAALAIQYLSEFQTKGHHALFVALAPEFEK